MLLYSMVELGKAAWAKPIEKTSGLLSQAFLPPSPLSWMPWAREQQAFFELSSRISKSYAKPEWNIPNVEILGAKVEVSEELVLERDFGNLIYFNAKTKNERKDPIVLLVAPMSGHYPTLLRDTVEALLPNHRVFLTEWKNVRDIPVAKGDFSLDNYVEYLIDFMTYLGANVGPVHLMSVCQPTVPSLAAVSLMASKGMSYSPASMIMIGGPIDARLSPTAVTNFALEHDLNWFERHLISMVPLPYQGAGRLVYPGFLQHMGFVAMNPRRHIMAHQDFFSSLTQGDDSAALKHREFYDEYNAVMDLPKTYYMQTIKHVFQNFDLAKGSLHLCGTDIEPQKIKDLSILSIEGELDDISGAGQTHAVHKLCSGIKANKKEAWTAPGVGHYGVFSGSKFRQIVAPRIAQFTAKNSE